MVTTATIEAKTVAEAVEKVNEIHSEFGKNVDIDLAILADDEAEEQTLFGATTATGAIQFENFTGLTKMPQKAASAWAAVEELIGAEYLPLLYVGTQPVRGVNHLFIAQATSVTANPKKKIVKLEVNEFQGKFAVVGNKTKDIFV